MLVSTRTLSLIEILTLGVRRPAQVKAFTQKTPLPRSCLLTVISNRDGQLDESPIRKRNRLEQINVVTFDDSFYGLLSDFHIGLLQEMSLFDEFAIAFGGAGEFLDFLCRANEIFCFLLHTP
jgi:hypothetical protein